MKATQAHARGTMLADEDGIPRAVVLGHTKDERDLATDLFALVSEAAEITAVDWTHDDEVLRGVTLWIVANSDVALWRYATDEDQEEYGVPSGDWCGGRYRGAEVWVLTWDAEDAMGKAEELGIASTADDD